MRERDKLSELALLSNFCSEVKYSHSELLHSNQKIYPVLHRDLYIYILEYSVCLCREFQTVSFLIKKNVFERGREQKRNFEDINSVFFMTHSLYNWSQNTVQYKKKFC